MLERLTDRLTGLSPTLGVVGMEAASWKRYRQDKDSRIDTDRKEEGEILGVAERQ